jgi:hypothetical protein
MSVPYVALGDSLTHGMQSLGVAAISQDYSYPRQIARFLGIDDADFQQPTLKGWLPGKAPPGQTDGWVGHPPNLELVLRRAEDLLNRQPNGYVPDPTLWQEVGTEVGSVVAVLREALTDYARTIENVHPEDLLAEPRPEHGYQNLGIFDFYVADLSSKSFQSFAAPHISFRNAPHQWLDRLVEHFAPSILSLAPHAHPSVFQALVGALWIAVERDFASRLRADSVGYVLGRDSTTMLQAAEAQQPKIVTLWIGNNDLLKPMTDARLWKDGQPLFTKPDDFCAQMDELITAILAIPSKPYLFVATLPSATASPNLVRSRLGHWKSMFPSAIYLLDSQLFELEAYIGEYNRYIKGLDSQPRYHGRVWHVDVHALQERMLRGTRDDLRTAQRMITHAVRAGLIDRPQAQAALAAARSGNLKTIRHAHDVAGRLGKRSFASVEPVLPKEGGLLFANSQYNAANENENLDAFVVKLKSGQYYRLTGDFLAAGDDGTISQGGAVGLDAIHLTNIGYAYVAREFINAIYAANRSSDGAVLGGLPHAPADPVQFDDVIRSVAQADSLLNAVPRLLPAVMDAAGAMADMLGEIHFSDPYLTR